jgi:hypothetical protein
MLGLHRMLVSCSCWPIAEYLDVQHVTFVQFFPLLISFNYGRHRFPAQVTPLSDFGWHFSRSNIISSSEAMKPAVLLGNTLNHRTILHLLMSDM